MFEVSFSQGSRLNSFFLLVFALLRLVQWFVKLPIGWGLCWVFVFLFVFPLMGKVEWGGNPICWWFMFCLLFRWGILHRVLLVVGWCWILYSSGFLCVSSYYLILPREKAMAPHSSTLAWKIPWTEEPGRLQSMGSLGVGYDWATSLFTFMHWRRKWQPTPVFLPGESQGWGSLVGCRLWGHTESDTTEAT